MVMNMGFASLWDKLLTNPERNSKILGLIFLFQLIPLVLPLGLPIKYSFYTLDNYKVIEGTDNPEFPGPTTYGATWPGIQPGDVVVWGSNDEHAASWSQARDWWSTWPRWFMGEKGAKMIFACFGYSSIGIFNDLIDRYFKVQYPDITYGEDYVVTEYLPGAEAAMARFAEQLGNIRDINGRTINSYPAFADYQTLADVQYSYGSVIRTTDHDMFIRQFGSAYPYETTGHVFLGFMEYAVASAYYGTIVKCCAQYDFETEAIVAAKYGRAFLGEQIALVEARQIWAFVYLPLLVYGLLVNWQRALSEGVSLQPEVGSRGQ
jgi:hypothetical protein